MYYIGYGLYQIKLSESGKLLSLLGLPGVLSLKKNKTNQKHIHTHILCFECVKYIPSPIAFHRKRTLELKINFNLTELVDCDEIWVSLRPTSQYPN